MEKTPTQNKITRIKTNIIKLLIKNNAFSPKNEFVTIDKLWQDPTSLNITCKSLSDFIRLVIPVDDVSGIISMDNVIFPFGPIPIACCLSASLKLPLGIWKENDDPITGDHRIYGTVFEENGLVLFDVLRFGLVALRMMINFHEQGICPKWFISIVDCEQGGLKMIQEEVNSKWGYNLEMIPVLELSEISKAYSEYSG